MLVTKTQAQLENGKVYGFKLATGEEIIGTVSAISSTSVSVNKPHFLSKTVDGVAWAPALTMMSIDSDPVYVIKNLVAYFKLDKQWETAYTDAMSDIIVPDNTVIV